ncbi:MAG: hypothetical protein ACPG8F_07600 [Flavobacteriaceae bacterium]
MKQFIILFFCATIMFAQDSNDGLFSSNEPLETKIAFSPKVLRKSNNDTLYFDTPLQYKANGEWKEMEIGIRARGNFRRATCYYPPVKVDLKKKQTKETMFQGQKKLKLVLPCKKESDKNDNILKELMVYKLFELVTPYHFKTRRLTIEFTDQNKKKTSVETINGFFIEDDKKVAKRAEGKVFERYIHPMAMDSDASIRNALFQYMIGNTDFSTAYQHNGKLLYVGKKIVPLPYDFDMSGFINPSYAVVNETLGIKSIRDRKYRGFKRADEDFQKVREVFIAQKQAMYDIMKSYEADFDSQREFDEAYGYVESFFEIIEDDEAFQKNVISAARTK